MTDQPFAWIASSTTLDIIKYGGFAITAAAAIWGLLKETTTKDGEGNKRLTRSGYVAVLLAIGSAFLATSATALGAYLDGEKQGRADRKALEDEIKADRRAEWTAFQTQRHSDRLAADADAKRQIDAAKARADAADLRAKSVEQRLLLLAARAESRERLLGLSQQVNTGTRDNLARTQTALGQLERLMQPINGLNATFVWELDLRASGNESAATRLAELARHVPRGRFVQGNGIRGSWPEVIISRTSPFYPQPSERALLQLIEFPTANVSFFRDRNRMQAEAPTADLKKAGDYRLAMGTASTSPDILYNIETGRLAVVVEVPIPGSRSPGRFGDFVSVLDIERAAMAVEFEPPQHVMPRAGGIMALLAHVVPRSLSLSVGGRPYVVEGRQFRRLERPGRSPIFMLDLLGPQQATGRD